MSHTTAQGDFCFFITMSMTTILYFESIPHEPLCCCEYRRQHQLFINPLLKIVPQKSTICSCLGTFAKSYSAQLLQEITFAFFKMFLFASHFKRFRFRCSWRPAREQEEFNYLDLPSACLICSVTDAFIFY